MTSKATPNKKRKKYDGGREKRPGVIRMERHKGPPSLWMLCRPGHDAQQISSAYNLVSCAQLSCVSLPLFRKTGSHPGGHNHQRSALPPAAASTHPSRPSPSIDRPREVMHPPWARDARAAGRSRKGHRGRLALSMGADQSTGVAREGLAQIGIPILSSLSRVVKGMIRHKHAHGTSGPGTHL